jgi:hypothetical protein
MERLGTAAMGMFVRRRLDIGGDALTSDLQFFGFDHATHDMPGRRLTDGDRLFGGFFFVRKSRVRDPEDGERASFEFLHNTFGEFLTADFVLRRLLQITQTLSRRRDDSFAGVPAEKQYARWFAAMSYAPLHARPVIVRMLREWAKHRVLAAHKSHEDFVASLEELVAGELRKVLGRWDWEGYLDAYRGTDVPRLPLLTHLATYSVNLLLLRTVLPREGTYLFDTSRYAADDQGEPIWTRLLRLWQATFTWAELSELAALINVTDLNGRTLVLRVARSAAPRVFGSSLESIANSSARLHDDLTTVLAGLATSPNFIESSVLVEAARNEGLSVTNELALRGSRYAVGAASSRLALELSGANVEIPIDVLFHLDDEDDPR